MVTAELSYKCITPGFVIDECRITIFFNGYSIKLVKQVRFFLPDHDYFLWGHLKDLVTRYPKLLQVCIKCLLSLNVYANHSTDSVKHVGMLMDAILSSYCKPYTHQ